MNREESLVRVVLGTNNRGKLTELRAMLEPLGVDVRPLSEFSKEAPEESGLTFIENAILKARHATRVSGLPAIADDSGIEVEALGGAPGVYSARYAGENASDEENLRRLLAELEGRPTHERAARYCCALAFLRFERDPFPILAQASWAGRITTEPRGTGGFGYDPIFELPELGVTVAELPAEQKNEMSHRGQALRQLVGHLRADEWLRSALTTRFTGA
ncbi:MAG TPA: RdgB/HAM1 family non-canonical purine NTP pyrophosphatase [Steroidobacter sp.]